jgi:PIN domain nuclease of toxin-antitoxin system
VTDTGLVLDTHTSIWYLVGDRRLSRIALQAIREIISAGERCYVPSICLVEATYLAEKGRIPQPDFSELIRALDDPDSSLGCRLKPAPPNGSQFPSRARQA